MRKTIIGISGKKRSGKDTTAQYITQFLPGDSEIVHFADDMKKSAAIALGLAPDFFKHDISKLHRFLVDINPLGEPVTMTGREFLQKFGTDCIRNVIGQEFWVVRMMEKIADLRARYIIIPDVRFPNEYHAIKQAGGLVVRINREEAETGDTHPSETALDDFHFDFYIDNNGPLMSRKYTGDCVAFCEMIKKMEGMDHVGEDQARI